MLIRNCYTRRLWRVVVILRVVDSILKEEQSKREGRNRLIAIHGNRFVLNRVFRVLPTEKFDDIGLDVDSVKQDAAKGTVLILNKLTEIVNKTYIKSYPANLFKSETAAAHPRSKLRGIRGAAA